MAVRSLRPLALALALLSLASHAQAIDNFFGYQEGTRRNVTCMEGGYFRGMEVTFSREGGYSEEFLTGLRLLCTSFHIDIEYWGSTNDSFSFGLKGKSENPVDLAASSRREAVCPDGAGINKLTWRPAAFHPGQSGEIRIGGFTLRCSDGSTVVVDPGQPQSPTHPHSDGCKEAAQKLVAVEMWFWTDNFSGFTPLSCA